MEAEQLVSFGGSLKALDDSGRVGGFLVLFGDQDNTDASRFRDYFTPETDFGLDLGVKARFLYNHGLDPELGARSLGLGSLKVKDAGVWVEGQLSLADDYEKAIFGMVKAGKLGLSSGTASHLIRREAQSNGASKILSWPLGLDASLTPTPAEPRTRLTCVALKSLPVGSLKGEFLGQFAEVGATMAAYRTLQDRAADATFNVLADEKMSPKDRLKRITAIHNELRDTLLGLVTPLLTGPTMSSAAASTKSVLPSDRELEDEFLRIQAQAAGVAV